VSAQVPGRSQFGPAVDAFDLAADELLERLRGHPLADRLFLAASHVGDWSLIWHVAGLTRGLARRRPAIRPGNKSANVVTAGSGIALTTTEST